jgi:hypothetical protein
MPYKPNHWAEGLHRKRAITTRLFNALHALDVMSPAELSQVSIVAFLKLRNVGRGSLHELQRLCAQLGVPAPAMQVKLHGRCARCVQLEARVLALESELARLAALGIT